jgi:hypothetical protein
MWAGALALGLTARAAAAGDGPTAKWDDGRTTLAFDGAEIGVSNRMQIRFTGTEFDGDGTIGSFRLRRARTLVDGWLHSKSLRFELMVDWVDSPIVEDMNLNWDLGGQHRFQVKAGQFKVPFGRQELTSDTALQFVDRSIVSAEFQKGRDVGLQAWGLLAKDKVEYRVGVFNGNGRGKPSNDDGKVQYDARVTFQPWRPVKYVEGDLDSSPRPVLAVGASFETNDTRPRTGPALPPAPDAVKRRVVGGDVAFKLRGFSLMAEAFDRRITPVAGPAYDSDGFHVQAGQFLLPGRLEVALRLARWDPSGLKTHDGRRELGAGISYFATPKTLKLQADYRRLRDAARSRTDSEARVQVQFIF